MAYSEVLNYAGDQLVGAFVLMFIRLSVDSINLAFVIFLEFTLCLCFQLLVHLHSSFSIIGGKF